MKQKKLVLIVSDSVGNLIIEKNPASFEHVQSALMMYDEIGTTIQLQVREVEINQEGKSS